MLLGFKKRFVNPINIGTKDHTVRNRRKNRPKVGEILHMYTALRTKHCELITNKHILQAVQEVDIAVGKYSSRKAFWVSIRVDKKELSAKKMEEFFIRDGFKNHDDFCEYWLDGKDYICMTGLDLFHWSKKTY